EPDDGFDYGSLAITGNPANGQVTNYGYSVRYTSNPGFVGTDSFQYTVKIGRASGRDTATVTVTVNPNAPPVARDDTPTTLTHRHFYIDVFANDSEPDDGFDYGTVAITANPANGQVTNYGYSVRYTSNPGFVGTDSFQYTV